MQDRLSSLRVVDPVLTTVATGYKNPIFINEYLFPIAHINKEGGSIPLFNKDAFKVYLTERAIRADSNILIPDTRNSMEVVLKEHDIVYPIDYRESRESMFDEETRAIKRAKDVIELRREVAAADLVQNPNTYPGSFEKINASDQWTETTGDPLSVIENAKEEIRKKIGIRPNTLVMGAQVYKVLKYHAQLQAALGANEHKIISRELISELLDFKNVVIGESVMLTNKNDITDIWGNNLILAYVAEKDEDDGDYETPSFGYTLRRRDMPEADTYDGQGGKIKYCRYTDIYKTVVVGSDAGYLIQSCVKVH